MDDDARIRITERSLELGESTIPSRAEEFTEWVDSALSEHDGAEAAEVTVRFPGERTLGDVLTFLDGVDASDELRTDVSEVTLVLRPSDD